MEKVTQEGRAGLDRLRPVCFRIKWALEDGGMESVVGWIHAPDNGRSVWPWTVTMSLGGVTLVSYVWMLVACYSFCGSDQTPSPQEIRFPALLLDYKIGRTVLGSLFHTLTERRKHWASLTVELAAAP